MKIFALFAASAQAAVGKGTLELTVANESGAGFNGKLNIYLGRNCNINTTTGRICDYKYLQYVSGLSVGKTYSYPLSQDIDPDNDQILMTYRDGDQAIFSGMKLTVNLGSATRIIDFFKLAGQDEKYMAFDFDSRNHPCHSSYPRGTSCSSDNTFDFYTMKTKPHYSLLRGHVVKRSAEPELLQYSDIGEFKEPRASSQFKLKTGKDRNDGSNAPLNLYYGKNCNANICSYEKVAEIVAKNSNTEYSLWMPDFDWNKDQLIIDYRDSDLLNIVQMSFEPCLVNNCKYYDLRSFGTSSTFNLAFDYDSPEEPCGERSYGDYQCQYDAVFDFKKMVKYMDRSVFVGQ